MPAVADTNVLVYAFDARFPAKRDRAADVLARGAADGTVLLPHQAIVEFVAVTTRPLRGGVPLLPREEALRLAHGFLDQFDVLWPDGDVLRTALAGTVLHGLPWGDAHLWAHAEAYGIPEILSEDFTHDRVYGSVRVVDPFVG